MEQNHTPFTPEAATDEPASSVPQTGETEAYPFNPVPVRYRRDGWTPEKQREFVEALADTGLIREAAARVGMTEQSVSRLRRRPDARAFDLACEAVLRPAARRLHAIAWERAIEGTIRRHYYHGELKAEERVYDNRLLIYLLGKTQALVEPRPEATGVEDNWEGWMEAIEQGLPEPPVLSEAEGATPDPDPEDAFDGSHVWQNMDGTWWTRFPPPAAFEGMEEGELGAPGYRRTLSAQEQAVVDAGEAEEAAKERALRDRYFGFEGGEFSSPWEPNL
jgi:hypothetical protein